MSNKKEKTKKVNKFKKEELISKRDDILKKEGRNSAYFNHICSRLKEIEK